MSLSTISSATYDLLKYSRCYTTPSIHAGQDGSEWQHFSNPIIRLVLDVKKSAKGDLQSFRLRIVWRLNDGPDSMNIDHRDVVFEDLDLLSYSSVPALASNSSQSVSADQGLPLKAVFRGSVVGIRYQHPRVTPAGATALYRRFQVTFQNPSAASELVKHIRFVCPCKANPEPSGMANLHLNPSILRSDSRITATQRHIAAPNAPVVSDSNYAGPSSDSAHTFATPSLPVRHQHDPLLAAKSSTSMSPIAEDYPLVTPAPLNAHAPSVTVASDSESTLASSPSGNVYVHTSNIATPSSRTYATQTPSSGMRPTSAPSTTSSRISDSGSSSALTDTVVSSDTGMRNEVATLPAPALDTHTFSETVTDPPVPVHAYVEPHVHPQEMTATGPGNTENLVQSLGGISTMYGLSRGELEKLVAQVVREEGFVNLLRDLDSLWAVKGYLAR